MLINFIAPMQWPVSSNLPGNSVSYKILHIWYISPQINIFVVFITVRLKRTMEFFYPEELKLPLIYFFFPRIPLPDTLHWLYSGPGDKNNLLKTSLRNDPEKC